jgi:predicted HTH transcriptional regulator
MIFFCGLPVSKYAKITKVSTDTALRDIQDLMVKGIMEQEGSGRGTSYKLRSQ